MDADSDSHEANGLQDSDRAGEETPSRRLVLLLPSHGIEDLPDSPEEAEAEELMAVFACLAHPSAAKVVDRPPWWDRADMPPSVQSGDVILVPSGCESWIEPTWTAEATSAGAQVIEGHQTFSQWFDAVTAAFGDSPWSQMATEAFASVGLTRLFLERFARRMHEFDGFDETRLWTALQAAACSVADGQESDEGQEGAAKEQSDEGAVSEQPLTVADFRRLLSPAMDVLHEYRERINPLDPALLDVILLESDQANDVEELLCATRVVDDSDNARDTEAANATGVSDSSFDLTEAPNFLADRTCWTEILTERPALADTVAELWKSDACDLLLGEDESVETRLEPTVTIAKELLRTLNWTRDTFGRRPRVWARRDFGLHPDLPMLLKSAGYEGAIHLTFDVGTFPELEEAKLTWQSPDRTGIEAFSRLPLPVARAATFWQFPERLGESVELDAAGAVMFVRWIDSKCWWFRSFQFATAMTPVFGRFQTVSDFLAHSEGHGAVLSPHAREYGSAALAKRAAKESADPLSAERTRWQRCMESVYSSVTDGMTAMIKGASGVSDDDDETTACSATDFAAAVADDGQATGKMVINPTPMVRTAVLPSADRHRRVEVPPYGYAWIADDEKPFAGRPLVDEFTLQNEHFQFTIHEATGGIKRLRLHGRRGNFLSEHVARRFGDSDDDYGVAEATSIRVVENTAAAATIETVAKLAAPAGSDDVTVTQRFRVVRGRPWMTVDVSFEGATPAEGNPWIQYDAVRFAWSSEASVVSQSCDLVPSPAAHDRLESAMFVEIDDDPVVTIAMHGTAFHRRDRRRLDCLVGLARESVRESTFAIGVGLRNPGAFAVSSMLDDGAYIVSTPRPKLEQAWLIAIDRPGVVLLAMNAETDPDGNVWHRFRLRETSGVAGTTALRTCRKPSEALARDLAGRCTDRMTLRDGAVEIRFRAFQLRDIMVRLE